MLDAGFDVSLHGGFYQDGDALDPDEMVGHAWLEVDGGIFDPTAAQFDSAPESWRYEDTEHALEGNELRDALSRADVARLGNPALQPHERRARAHERLVDEHHPLLHLPARLQNPLASTAFETYHEQHLEGRHKLDWTPYRMEEAMHAAEKRFAVALVGPLYGCGTYGCAAPLMDGRVLKVTIDEYEARWARLTRRYQVPGMVQIDTSPVVVGLDDWYNGEPPEADEDMVPVAPFKIWAYVREQASDLPDPTNWPPRLRSSRVEKLHEGHQFFRSLGYELGDWQRPDNVGLNQDGHVVVRDGRVSPRLSPRRRQNPTTVGRFIHDADLLDRMARVEGESWRRYQLERPHAREGVLFHQRAWFELQSDPAAAGIGYNDYVAFAHDAASLIYGDGGYARYIVHGDGEVVLDGGSTRPERAELARREGFRVVGEGERLDNPGPWLFRKRCPLARLQNPTPHITPEVADAMILAGQKAFRECPPQPVNGVRSGTPRWDKIRHWLLLNDPEALDYMRDLLDEKRCASVRAKLRGEKRADAIEKRYQSQGIDLEEAAYRGPAALKRAARGKLVWLYHGTSSNLLASIRQHGLRIGDAKVDPTETPGVYLTALPGRGDHNGAYFYARRAASALGGEPVVLRVLVPFDELAPDRDDEDISTGNWQFVTDYVPVASIMEINGERTEPTRARKSPVRKRNPSDDALGRSFVRVAPSSSRQNFWDQPLLQVYHGTSSTFGKFSPSRVGVVSTTTGGDQEIERHGIFFAEDPAFAKTFGGRVIPAYLNIQKPMWLDGGFDESVLEALISAGFDRKKARLLSALSPINVWQAFDGPTGEQLVAAAKAAGYDGALIEEESVGLGDDAPPSRTWIAFDDSQVFRRGEANRSREKNPSEPWVFRKRFTYALTRRPASTTTVPHSFVELGPATAALPFGTVTFERPLPRGEIEAFELEPLDPDDPIVLKRARQIYRDEVYETFTRTNGFAQPDAEGGHTTLSYSTREGVTFQVTFWQPDWTPTGHLDVNDFDEAVGSLWSSMPKAERRQRAERAVWRARR